MAKISDVQGREILDSRGNPTVKAIIYLDNGISADAAVPSGASTGTYEAYELRDNDPKRYGGLGVLKAVENIETKIKPAVLGKDTNKQEEIDKLMIELDGTQNKKSLGANSILAVSLAYARASTYSEKIPLYRYISNLSGNKITSKPVTPIFNIVNGGLHGLGNIPIQEFIIVPMMNNYLDSLRAGVEVYHQLKKIIKERKLYYGIGDEGGFTPNLNSNMEVLDLIYDVIKSSPYKPDMNVRLALDLASTTFFKNGYYYPAVGKPGADEDAFIGYIKLLTEKYNLISVEDPLAENEWEGWKKLTLQIGNQVLIVGDDLLVTNKKRLEKAIAEKACNTILVKLNQIGTLTETLEVIGIAKKAGMKIIISHRSGETNDDFIADLAVAVAADFAKFGAPARGERVIKYNRLSEIYREISQLA